MELSRARERRKIQDEMRALALNVFLQGRRLLNHNSTVKSLTGFGTAAAADLFLKSKDVRDTLFPPSRVRSVLSDDNSIGRNLRVACVD